jgi:primosomal protein N' (replication factor Y) (superfamily II helicase)
MIAEVVVDVPAANTDRLYDYLIPEAFLGLISPGVRVIVPFGNRKLQGFVLSLKEETDFDIDKLKSIEDVMDLYPVLTNELLDLGKWLADTTLSFSITAYQSMLPAALKASYVKEVALEKETTISELPEEIQPLYNNEVSISWDELKKLPNVMVKQIHKCLKTNLLEIKYDVKSKGKLKKIKYIQAVIKPDFLKKEIESLNSNAIRQKEVLSFFLENSKPVSLIDLIAQTNSTHSTVQALVKKGVLTESLVEQYRDPYENREFKQSTPFPLTEEQETAIKPILSSIEVEEHQTFLLRGVTGSGKTEVYLQSIQEVLKKGKQAIMLVPEISLTPQMVKRFKERFGNDVAVMHSGLSQGEKYDEWRKVYRQQANVVVGARSAIFAPLHNIGLIIIDEEHESSYKQEESPRYHARDVSIWRGKHHRCPVVLGSATPSLETNARADKGVYKLCELSKRVNNQKLPVVNVIDMREELREGNRSLFSRSLFEALQSRLERGEQSVLFLNRRGYSTFVICRDCGHVEECPHCDISLTFHKKSGVLRCHYCGFEKQSPKSCPSCESSYIRFFGTGTQKIEEELNKLLPEARVIRMDVDTTSRKGMHEKLLNQFGEGKADILLGTQMIAKGLDFPKVTLVGVLAADSMLHIPDFRSSEKTFQLLTQVSGRAGRAELEGEVVIQTYTPEHYSIQLAKEHDFISFYQHEMKIRKVHQHPPFYFLALITISHSDLMYVIKTSEKILKHLQNKISPSAILYGPVASPIPRIKDRYRYHCMIKYKKEPELYNYLREILKHFHREMLREGLQINIDPNAQTIM